MRLALSTRPPTTAAFAYWSRVPPTSDADGPPGAAVDHYEAPATILPGEAADIRYDRIRERLLAYDIFPPDFIQGTVFPDPTIVSGSIIVQRILLGPLAVEMAVRVIEQWDRDEGGSLAAGFRYVTLAGHPERGVASFEVRATPDGPVIVALGARSTPGHTLSRFGRPVARRVQQTMTRRALHRLTAS